MTVIDTTNLSYETFKHINSRLAPGAWAKTLPAGWTAGKIPVHALPLDDFISGLLIRTRKPKLRPLNELGHFRFGECPYAVARSGVAYAVFFAAYRTEQQAARKFSIPALRKLKNEIPELREGILTSGGVLNVILAAESEEYEPVLNEALSDLQGKLFEALRAIDRSTAMINDVFLKRTENSGNLWRIWFVSSLFGTWWRLTNSDPSPASEQFLEFLDKAWESLSPRQLPEMNWESAIRTARKNMGRAWRHDVDEITVTPRELGSSQNEQMDLWLNALADDTPSEFTEGSVLQSK